MNEEMPKSPRNEYFIYRPIDNRFFWHWSCRIAQFTSITKAAVFTSVEDAKDCLIRLPCVEHCLQVIDEDGEVYYEREANYPQKDFLWEDPDGDYEPDYFREMAQ